MILFGCDRLLDTVDSLDCIMRGFFDLKLISNFFQIFQKIFYIALFINYIALFMNIALFIN